MSVRSDAIFVLHILDAADKIAAYVKDLSEDAFRERSMVHDAVIRQIEIIGEATKNLSPEFRASHSAIPWGDMAGMRDKLIHGYMGVDLQAVWDTARDDVPALSSYLRRVVGSGEGSNGT
ncbi:MAG: DUF86 domain-containing protein [Gemmatimonas sp.]|nr:DUF86 domain-containing protein [Gemmatimonas sp.]